MRGVNESPEDDLELDVSRLRDALKRTRNGTEPARRELGPALDEMDAWLADDRQWGQTSEADWRALLEDVSGRLRPIIALASKPLQGRIAGHQTRLKELRGRVGRRGVTRDDSLRRRLRRIGEAIRADALDPELLISGWHRAATWAREDAGQADEAACALRDLLELHGHDGAAALERVDRILADSGWEIASVKGTQVTGSPRDPAGMTAADRLRLVDELLRRPPTNARGVVWLEYLQAELHYPWILSLGPSLILYDHGFLRSTIHQAPDDDRLPDDLRGEEGGFLRLWLHAFKAEEATKADFKVRGDPRIYLRIELGEMSPKRLLAAARENAEFLAAFGSLTSDNHDVWILSDSHHIPDHASSTSAPTVNEDRAQEQLPHDVTAVELHRYAEQLGRHLPLRSPELRIAGRLLVWLRQAVAQDNPARLVLCDRVVEQVSGWAGVASRSRFVTEYLKPAWIYEQVRRETDSSYRLLGWELMRNPHPIRAVIETEELRPPYTTAVHLPAVNLKTVLERLAELVEIAREGSEAAVSLSRLQRRTVDARAITEWLNELSREFDERNGRLRRTRNALMHGGPLVPSIVDDDAHFSTTLAYLALSPAVFFLLADDDVTDGFLDRQQRHLTCFDRLRAGDPASEALFWDV
jgi:hypothetical protein